MRHKNVSDVIHLRERLTKALGKYGFGLSKWVSNDIQVLRVSSHSEGDPVF